MSYIIQLEGITKRFPGVTANDHIDINVEKGEIHTLAGENGAGKSTLMNILFGLYRPTEGNIYINGKRVEFQSSKDSIKCGIGMVHQHFMLVPKLTVTENIIAGQEPGKAFVIDRKKATADIKKLSDMYGLRIDPEQKVANLTVTEQQKVEILKVLYRKAEILIFDEPTAVLTPQEIDEFCEILLKLKKNGKTILFISHKLAEVFRVSDKITVIRLGKVVGTKKVSETNAEEITRMMVGRTVNLNRKERPVLNGDKILELENVEYAGKGELKKLNQISFSVKGGEVLGVAGIDGNGQHELVEVICGLLKPTSGKVKYHGKDISQESVRKRKDAGIACIPEDRHLEGLVLDYSIEDNLILGHHHLPIYKKGRFIADHKKIHENGLKLKEKFDIRCPGVNVAASTLSGGNQQKIIIAREVTANPDLLIAVQPTRGLDVGAEEFVHQALYAQRNQGKAVLLIYFELDEILAISDRIMVLHKGKIVGTVDANHTTREEIGAMMLGLAEKTKEEKQHEAESGEVE